MRTVGGTLKDVGVTALKGAVGLPQAGVGLLDMATGGRAGKALEDAGLRFKDTQEILDDSYSPAQKAANQKVRDAEGFVGTGKAMLENPSTIATAVGESVPQMLGGAGVARGLMQAAPRVGAAVAGAIGEGVVGAGSAAEQIRQQTDDGLLTGKQVALSGATGAATAAFGAAGGKVAQRLGVGDADTMLAQGAIRGAGTASSRSLPRQVAEGALSEGVLEEMPQSMSEQALQNLALDRDVGEGVGAAAAGGLLTGGAMGGGASLARGLSGEARPASTPAEAGASAFVAGQPAEPPAELRSVAAKAQWAKGWRDAEAAARAQPGGELALVPQDQPLAPEPATDAAGLPPYPGAVVQRTFDPRDPRSQPALDLLPTAPTDGLPFDAGQPHSAQQNFDTGDLQLEGASAPVPRPSEAMGLDASVGPLSAAAVQAVDGGATEDMAARAAQQQEAEAAQLALKKGGAARPPAKQDQGVDEDGVIASPENTDGFARWSENDLRAQFQAAQDPAARRALAVELQARRQQREQDELRAELDAELSAPDAPVGTPDNAFAQISEDAGDVPTNIDLPPAQAEAPPLEGTTNGRQADQAQQVPAQQPEAGGEAPARRAGSPGRAAPTAPRAGDVQTAGLSPAPQGQRLADAGAAWTRMPVAERRALASRTDVKPVLRKNLARGSWDNFNVDVRRKLAAAMQPAAGAAPAPEAAAAPAVRAPVARLSATAMVSARSEEIQREDPGTPPAEQGSPKAQRSEQILEASPESISEAAGQAATSPSNDRAEPTQAQKDAGNYAKGHTRLNGHDISIENPAGSRRRPEWPPLQNHYGYIRGTVGKDKDHVDVFMTDRAADPDLPVFVIDQNNSDGTFDEHKVVMGTATEAEARATYLGNYSPGWQGLGAITQMSQADFKAWVRDPKKTSRPAAPRGVLAKMQQAKMKRESKSVRDAREREGARADYFAPGNVVPSFGGGHDRVVSYSPSGADGRWSVTVLAVEKRDGEWVTVAQERERTHATEPTALALRRGPTERGLQASDDGPRADAPDAAELQRRQHAASEEKRRAAGQRARARAWDDNPGRAFIAKHGVALDLAAEWAPGAGERRAAMVQGYGPIFRKSGLQLDALAQAAVEEGFLVGADEQAMHDLIDRVLRKQRVVPQYTAGAMEDEVASRIARQREFEEDAALALDALDAEQQEQINRLLAEISNEEFDTEVAAAQAAASARQRDPGPGGTEEAATGGTQDGGAPGDGSTDGRTGRVEEAKRDVYTRDLFGNIVDWSSRPNSAVTVLPGDVHATAPVSGDTPAPAGQYLVRTIVGRQAERQLGTSSIRSFADLAAATHYLYRSAVERFDGVVTDAGGKPLAIVGGFKGALTQTSVYPATLVSEAVRIPGAARIWFSHNHPSGKSDLSTADFRIEETLRDVFRGSGVEPMGLIAVTDSTYSATNGEWGRVRPAESGVKVPVVEREQIPSNAGPVPINSPQDAKRTAKIYYDAASEPGLMLLDARHQVTGWVPIPPAMRGDLRGTGQLNAVYRAVSESNAAAVILVHGGELSGKHPSSVSVTVGQNIAAALEKVDVRALDMIDARTSKSVAEQGLAVSSGPVFRRSDGTEDLTPAVANAMRLLSRPTHTPAARAQAVASVERTVSAIRQAWGNSPDVVVAFDMGDPVIPAAARRADLKQRSGGARGAPEGFYYRGKAYLMASRLATPNDAARVLFHEVLGHHGLRGHFGKQLDGVLNQIATMRKAEVDAKIKEYGLRGVNRLDRRAAAEEVLAEMAQATPEIGFVQRAVAAIRSWLRAHVPGFSSLALTDAEIIRSYILPARKFVERGGAEGGPDGDLRFSRASEPADAIQAVIDAARQPGHAPQKAQLGEVADWLADSAAAAGLQISGFRHVIDGSAVRHTIKNHYDAKAEQSRGQVAVSDADLIALPEVVQSPDRVIFGTQNRLGREQVGFVKRMPDGSILYLEEIRAGRKELAAVSVRKYPATMNVDTVASTLHPNARGDGGKGLIVLTPPKLGNDDGADDIRFSRASMADFKASALGRINEALNHPGKVSIWDKTVGTMRHLAERAPAFKPVFESAQRFTDDVSMLANDAADAAPRLLPRVDNLADIIGKDRKRPISAEDNKAVARPLFEGTLLWGRDIDGSPALVDELTQKYGGLSADEKAQLMLRAGQLDANVLKMWRGMPVSMFDANVNSRFQSKMLKAGVVWSDAELRTVFRLTDQQMSLYREGRAAIDRSIDMTARADMLRALGDEYAPLRDATLDVPTMRDAMELLTETLQNDARANPDHADRLMDLNNLVVTRYEKADELMKAGYAPLSRFGRYTVDVVDSDGERQYFGMFETMAESNRMKAAMAREFPNATVTSGTMSQEAFRLFAGITPESLEMFGNMLGLDAEGADASDKAFQEYLRLAKNNHSSLKRLIHRKGIAGYSEDVGRVLASFVYSNARQAAGGLNAGTIETAINSIPKDQGELKDVAMGLQRYIRDPQEEGQAVRGMLFAQYLGGSVASAFVNMTQPFAVTLPWMSQFGGMRKASGQLARALKDMGRSLADRSFSYEEDLARALQLAEDDGVVSPQEIHQLMAQARGAGALRSGDGTRAGNARAATANAWERTKVAWGQPFALAEQFNRRSTFIASYRLAKEQGMASPDEFARKAVLETQFLYSKANKMRWARGAVGGTLMTFKTYSVSYLELMQRMWTQGGPEGKRAVGWALAMLMLMGGAGGLPFVEDLEDLIDGAGQLMGRNMSAKQWRKQLLQDVLGKELAEFVDTGISGLPGAPVDVSGRLGMGNLLPGTGLLLTKQSRERDLLEVAGPAGDLVARGFAGARKALTGDIAGAALEVSPTAVRNAAKGIDMATSGIYKDTKGYKVIDTTLPEALSKAIGFQPRSVAQVSEANGFMMRSKAFYTQTSSEIRAQWADALFNKDEAALKRVRQRLESWNTNNPDQPIAIRMPDIWKRVREMGKDRTQRIAETAPKALRGQMREMVAEASR